jgi:hypothetical protein
MKTDYLYYVAVKIDAGKLVKIYKDKKFKTYIDCYNSFHEGWASTYHKFFSNGQYAILEYTSQYDCRIVTIFTDTIETNLIKLI